MMIDDERIELRTPIPSNEAARPSAPPPVRLEGVGARYGRTTALDGIDLTIAPGSVVGLIGPNGAGKSTLVSLVAGLRPATTGTVRVLGLDPVRHRRTIRHRLGVQLQGAVFHDELTVREILRRHLACFDAPYGLDELLDLVDLAAKSSSRACALSGGQHQRLALAVAMAGRPELLVLDELSTGLDPASRRRICERIRHVVRAGTTVLLVSHAMDEVAELCDRLLLLQAGRITDDTTPARFVAERRAHDPGVRTLDDAFLAATGWDAREAAEATEADR